jgi:hypothetical protein
VYCTFCTTFFFNAFILRYYLSKPLTSLSCSLNAVFPGLKMWDTSPCATVIFLTPFIISIAVLENVPPDAGLQKRATFSTLNVGLWPGPRVAAQPSTTPLTNVLLYILKILSFGCCSFSFSFAPFGNFGPIEAPVQPPAASRQKPFWPRSSPPSSWLLFFTYLQQQQAQPTNSPADRPTVQTAI